MNKVIKIIAILAILIFAVYWGKTIILRMLYKTDYRQYVEKYAEKYGVEKELIYAGADCVMDINSTIEEVDLQIFSLARRNNKQKITQKQSETMINKGKLVMDHKKHKVFWNNVALHLTRQEYNFLYLLAVTPMRVYTFEQIYQLVWKDYSVGDIKNIIWCLVKRLRKKLNVVEDGAGNCIVSVRDIGYKFELNNENEQQ